MKQKRLIIFMPVIEGGGVEKNLFLISNYLKKKFNDISLITTSKKFRHKFDKKIKFIAPKSKFYQNIGRRKKLILGLCILFLEIFRNRNALVLSFQANIYCIILCKLLCIKIIVRSNSSPDGWAQNFFKFYLFKIFFKFADKIIVNSLDFKKKFKSKFNLNSICIYNPLNKKEILKKSKIKLKIKFNKNKLNLINVGRIVDQKDQITILRSLNEIKHKIDFRLLLVGNGVQKKYLLDFVIKNHLSKCVKFISFQKNPYNLIKNSDIFILSSKYEGLPNVLLEAQVLKTYIMSSNCPTGPREILMNGKAGSLFDVGDYKTLSNLILNFSKKKNYQKTLIGFKNLSRFDYKNNLEKYFYTINYFIKKD